MVDLVHYAPQDDSAYHFPLSRAIWATRQISYPYRAIVPRPAGFPSPELLHKKTENIPPPADTNNHGRSLSWSNTMPHIAAICFHPDIVRLLELQCEHLDIQCQIQPFVTLSKAMQAWTAGRNLPDAIVLDASLPMNATIAVREIRQIPGFQTMPICVAGAIAAERAPIEKAGALLCPDVDESLLPFMLELLEKRE